MYFLRRVLSGMLRYSAEIVGSEAAKLTAGFTVFISLFIGLIGTAGWMSGHHDAVAVAMLWTGAPGAVILAGWVVSTIVAGIRRNMPRAMPLPKAKRLDLH